MIRASQFRPFKQYSARYQIRAWGSERYPDINAEFGAIPDHLHKRYPFVDIARLDVVPLSAFKGLKDKLYG